MKRILLILHLAFSIILVGIVSLTSYLSPFSQIGPRKKKIDEKVDLGFLYENTWIWLRASASENDAIVLSYDTDSAGTQNGKGGMILIKRNGDIWRSNFSFNHDGMDIVTYIDENGDFMPERKISKIGSQLESYELDSAIWKLKKKKR